MFTFEGLDRHSLEKLLAILSDYRITLLNYKSAREQIINKILWYQSEIEKLRTKETDEMVRRMESGDKVFTEAFDLKGYVIPEPEKEDEHS